MLLASVAGFAFPAPAADRPVAAQQDMYGDCGTPALGAPVGRLDGHLLLRTNPFGPLCVARQAAAPDGAGADGVLCLYEPIGNVDARGHRQQDGSVRIEVEGKVPTAGWHHLALVAQQSREDGRELVYSFVGCRPAGMVEQVISKVHAVLRVADAPSAAFSVVIDSGADRSIVRFPAKPGP